MEILQAFIIGFLGSFHCAGMCGPIALSLPLKEDSLGTRVLSTLLYNSGRIATYGALGLIFGFLGYGLAFWGIQRWVSISMGGVMIMGALFPVLFKTATPGSVVNRALEVLKNRLSRLFRFRTYSSVLAIGLLNGFLPCGLVYVALAGAVVSVGPLEGMAFMMVFGLGTIPMLMAVSLAGNMVSVRFRNAIRKIIPAVVILIGVLFILRGLELGIPYVSPALQPDSVTPGCCK